ncbi:hypothetical protein FOVG_10172 [Fusarium oxysporum f. sp. pisi HDV247]|uniref:Uncharacterized protein n=1 Tax=Fusarium oxysporum f. sp. pisi HDV247 TaxID=1080344 RepID=W9NZ97_FUSOX|nr:hypothetical protein FOVG_10172 [Fusarium oxysporum f. sp. pisi HDV247]
MSAANETAQPARRGRGKADIDESLVLIVEAILQRRRAVTLDMMTHILQDGDSLINDDWDQADEDAVEAEWQGSDRKSSSDHVGTRKKNDDPLRDLWCVCVRIFGQTPPVLLSPYNRVQFIPEIVKDTFRLLCDLFTKDACNAIADLIVHPIWQQDHRPFIHALIYAANCRIGGMRNFRLLVFQDESCPVLQSLNATFSTIADEQLPRTVHQLHAEARQTAIARREEPSLFSDLTYRIGELASAERSPLEYERTLIQGNIFPFKMTDLDCMKKAIDELALSDDGRVGYPVKAVSDAFKALKRDEVPTRDQLPTRDLRGGASRSRSPPFRESNRAALRPRSRSQQAPDRRSTRQQGTPVTSSTLFPDQEGQWDRSSSSEQRGFDENGYLPDQGEFALGDDDFTPQAQEKECRRDFPAPAGFRRDDMMIQFPTADEMEQVRREMAQFRQQLVTETTERGRMIEHLTTEQSVAIEGLKTQHAAAMEAMNCKHSDAITALKTEHAKALTGQALHINELKARLNSRETGDQVLSERLSQFEATQFEQAEVIKYLQKENERLNQAVRSTNRARTPTPVDPPLPLPEEAPQCDGKALGDLSAYPPGFSFPSVLQTPIPASSRESFQGPALRRRNQSLRIEEGYGKSAVDAHKKNT